MLSIDEAIAHAREVANTQRGKSGICLQNGLECEHFSNCIKCAEEHEQLAEWLEELKALREEKSEFLIYAKDIAEANYEMGMESGYNKAIDDFAENISFKISDSFIWGKIADCFKSKNINDTSDEIIVYIINTANEIAEQLKKKI